LNFKHWHGFKFVWKIFKRVGPTCQWHCTFRPEPGAHYRPRRAGLSSVGPPPAAPPSSNLLALVLIYMWGSSWRSSPLHSFRARHRIPRSHHRLCSALLYPHRAHHLPLTPAASGHRSDLPLLHRAPSSPHGGPRPINKCWQPPVQPQAVGFPLFLPPPMVLQ
jgi:hypothetical protein